MIKSLFYGVLASVLAGALLTGCGKQDEPPAPDTTGTPGKSDPGKTPEKPDQKAGEKTVETNDRPAVTTAKADEAEYSADGKTLIKYKGTGTEFTVKDGVTTIGDNAFAGCDKLETVKFPDSLTAIGSRAFAECRNLNGVNLPAGVTSIGSGAFQDCNFKSIAIPSNATIGEKAFSGCGIEKVEPPPSHESVIGQGAFNGCPCEAYVVERCPNYKR